MAVGDYMLAAAAVDAGASLIGDSMSSAGQSGANEMNMRIAQTNNQFNSAQAALNRQNQDAEASINRRFQAGQVAQQEGYQTEMADTQMQRRVADLRAAGLNPALAYQLGGAAAPTGAAASGSMPGGAQASSAGNPQMQNPMAAFGQIGSQVSSAMQAGAQTQLMKAQSEKTNTETNTVLPAQVQNLQSQVNLNDVRANEAFKNVQMMSTLLEPPNSSDQSMYFKSNQAQLNLQTLKVQIASMDAQTQQDTMQSLIAVRNSENLAEKTGFMNIYNASDGMFGQIMSYFNLGKPLFNTAAGAAVLAGELP